MSQSNGDADTTKRSSNSDEIARSTLMDIVESAARHRPKSGGTHTKPPLPHNPRFSEESGVGDLAAQLSKSHTNRHLVYHPNHPDKMDALSSTSTAHSAASPPDDAQEEQEGEEEEHEQGADDATSLARNPLDEASMSLVSIPRQSTHNNAATDRDSEATVTARAAANGYHKSQSPSQLVDTRFIHRFLSQCEVTQYTELFIAAQMYQESAVFALDAAGLHRLGVHDTTHQQRILKAARKLATTTKSTSKEQQAASSFPKRFECQVQARVRAAQDLSSQHLTDLPEGSVVTVEEIVERRARVSRPLCGWLSVTSKFGARIILPTNSKYSKIGGKVLFKRPLSGQVRDSNGQYPTHAKVVDYNEKNGAYKVRYDDNSSQWIDLEHPSVQFVSQHKAVKVQRAADATAATFTLQTSQEFFNRFFCKDYPQFQARSSSTTRHMDISPVTGGGGGHRAGFGGFVPPPRAPGGASHLPPPPHPVNGHVHPHPHAAYPYGHPHAHAHAHVPPPHPQHYDPRRHGPPPPHPHGHPVYPPPHHPGYPRHNGHAAYPPYPAAPPPADAATREGEVASSTAPVTTDTAVLSNEFQAGNKPKVSEEFVTKVKEIERRIIQHLRQRGYDESHPDYHRYLRKAKELAIQKAGKERQKMVEQQQQRAQQVALQRALSHHDYEQYMRYRQEKQRQHAIHEEQRKQLRLTGPEPAAAASSSSSSQQQQQPQPMPPQPPVNNNNNNNNNNGGSKPSSSGAVKGLIVLRGLPGSGKTTLARKLALRSRNTRICTEDRYHWSGKEDGVGEYTFQPQLVFLAREWCTKEIRECIESNVNLIILDNHNARISMYEDHIQYAVENGYRFRIIEFVANAGLIDRYRARSYKRFPREVYVKLLKLWERDPRAELINPTFAAATEAVARDTGSGDDDANDPEKPDGNGEPFAIGDADDEEDEEEEEDMEQDDGVAPGNADE